ncbi:TIGR02300 family protein [Entomobacter blattae]|uniref:TIGR02300 family protein n=1 Tax=Entomobacter blattae TaxID=2762277 RepID=A0A7H1NTI5_9PROT|nr:TIGR02300 family protein [Entomobacter blattae]QNT79095.1 hypothetical protein JGUZn3_18810 [Entomobacter blattae]
MAKPELGTKRTCVSCNARFYDLGVEPAICPKCGAEQPLEAPRLRRVSGTSSIEQSEQKLKKHPENDTDLDTDVDVDVDLDPDEDTETEDDLLEDTSDLDDDTDAIEAEIEVISDKDDHDN